MSRGLTAGEISALQTSASIMEEHVKITTRTPSISGNTITYTNGTIYRFTTGQVDTVVAADGTYVPQSYINTLEYAEETYELTPSQVSLVFSTFDNTFINTLDTVNKFSTLIDIYKVLLDPSSRTISGRFLVYSGRLNSIDITGGKQNQTVSLRFVNNFEQFDRTTGRNLSSFNQARVYETIFWGETIKI